jgi:hypothetical protein
LSKAVVPTAKEINEAHQFAREHAETAVEWAVKCGKMLTKKKVELGHGKFQEWVKTYCDFAYSTAARYMKAGQNSTAVEISTLSKLYPPRAKALSTNSSKGAVPVVNPKGTGETGTDRPAAPHTPAAAAAPSPPPSEGEPERPEVDEDAAIAAAEAELAASIDKVMRSDDRLAAAYAEIKRQAAEIATLKISRDGYMNGKEAVTKLLKAAQRQIAALEKKLRGK